MSSTTNNPSTMFSREGLLSIDREATKTYGMPSIMLMENAARGAARIIASSIDDVLRSNVIVVCGSGNNGGDGYAAARHLANDGCEVRILQLNEPNTEDAKTNAGIVERMGIQTSDWSAELLENASLIIDAIFGTGLNRTVEGKYFEAIQTINANPAPCFALDIPSGLDCDTGEPHGCCIEAAKTISFVGMKQGFLNNFAEMYLGEVMITGIGCPHTLLQKYALTAT